MGSKKRKRDAEPVAGSEVDTSKPTAVFEPKEGRMYTLSVAIPGSIIANAQTPELQTLLAGQLARALAVFCVDEVVIFDDGQASPERSQRIGHEQNTYNGFSDPNHFLVHILSYLECPPHLRRALFPMHPDLRLAGTLPSLDMPHHLRKEEWCRYREGVVVSSGADKAHRDRRGPSKDSAPKGRTLVNTGLPATVNIDTAIPENTRLTVKFEDSHYTHNDILEAAPVAPSAPREEAGYYWGYSVRPASSLSAVLTECPFDGGYDLTFGTSERGVPVSSLHNSDPDGQRVPQFDHAMIVFGGVAGLELAVKADEQLAELGLKTPEALFDFWVDLCPGQGSRTIRTEEAVWLGLMGLRDIVLTRGRV